MLPPVLPRLLLPCPVQLAKCALSPLLLPGLDGNVHMALSVMTGFQEQACGISFYGTMPTWQLSRCTEHPACKIAMS